MSLLEITLSFKATLTLLCLCGVFALNRHRLTKFLPFHLQRSKISTENGKKLYLDMDKQS